MLATKLKQPVITDIDKVDKLILASLQNEMPLIREIAHHIIKSGGKRLRPLLVLLCARACGYQGEEHINLAAVIEFIHTATLLHDDVVDNSELRRGKATANALWGNKAAILVGDFLYSRSFQLMLQVGNQRVMQIVADTCNVMANGEVLQLIYQNDPHTSQLKYLEMIRSKTAVLFESAAQIGAVLANVPVHLQSAMAQFGLHLGTAYQLIDDLLDYGAEQTEFGKTIGIDCAEGKPTLPLIYLYHKGNEAQRALVEAAISQTSFDLVAIQRALRESGALEYTREFALREITLARQAISELPNTIYKTAALELAEFVVARTY